MFPFFMWGNSLNGSFNLSFRMLKKSCFQKNLFWKNISFRRVLKLSFLSRVLCLKLKTIKSRTKNVKKCWYAFYCISFVNNIVYHRNLSMKLLLNIIINKNIGSFSLYEKVCYAVWKLKFPVSCLVIDLDKFGWMS